ncbi:MAG: hypothetical protein ACFFER_04790 [Candidatus Thorarchaeota archaeon]
MQNLDKSGTRERLETFRQSLLASLDEDQLKKFDSWVKLTSNAVRMGLYALVFLTVLPEYEFLAKVISTTTLMLVYLAFEVLYQYASIRNAFDAKIQAVVFSIFAFWYGLSYSFLLLLGSFLGSIGISIIWAAAMMLAAVLLHRVVRSWLLGKLSPVIKHKMKRFESVITLTALRYFRKAAFNASSIIASLLLAYFLVLSQPVETIWWPVAVAILICFSIVLAIDIMRIDKFSESLDLLWIINDFMVTDLMTYSLDLCNRLDETGIVDYLPVFHHPKCVNLSDLPEVNPTHLVGTSLLLPEDREPVIVLHPVAMKIDLVKVMTHLDENWNRVRTPKNREGGLSLIPPFFAPDARILVDSSLIEANRVAWVSGKPCFGLEIAGSDLVKISSHVGQFQKGS